MSAFKGTPGPWEVVNGTDVFTRLGARNAAGVEAAANDGWHIADCDMGMTSTEEGEADIPSVERQANARLIAAAPDLLSVAYAVDAVAERMDYDPDSEFGELVQNARAAIAKATGEQS